MSTSPEQGTDRDGRTWIVQCEQVRGERPFAWVTSHGSMSNTDSLPCAEGHSGSVAQATERAARNLKRHVDGKCSCYSSPVVPSEETPDAV